MSTESAKENWEVPRGEREPNGCRHANLNVLALVRMHDLGQESISQAVKEGGLMSIRDDEAEGECRDIPHNSLFSLLVSLCVSGLLLSVCSPCACASG